MKIESLRIALVLAGLSGALLAATTTQACSLSAWSSIAGTPVENQPNDSPAVEANRWYSIELDWEASSDGSLFITLQGAGSDTPIAISPLPKSTMPKIASPMSAWARSPAPARAL